MGRHQSGNKVVPSPPRAGKEPAAVADPEPTVDERPESELESFNAHYASFACSDGELQQRQPAQHRHHVFREITCHEAVSVDIDTDMVMDTPACRHLYQEHATTIRSMARGYDGVGEEDVIDALVRTGMLESLNLSEFTLREPFLTGFYQPLTSTSHQRRRGECQGAELGHAVPMLWKWWDDIATRKRTCSGSSNSTHSRDSGLGTECESDAATTPPSATTATKSTKTGSSRPMRFSSGDCAFEVTETDTAVTLERASQPCSYMGKGEGGIALDITNNEHHDSGRRRRKPCWMQALKDRGPLRPHSKGCGIFSATPAEKVAGCA